MLLYFIAMSLKENLAPLIAGDVDDSIDARHTFSRDTSIFERTPSLVVYPKNAEDVASLVRHIHSLRAKGEQVSVTGRSAGTDMSGGSLTDSIVVSFTKYMNHVVSMGPDWAEVEPGMYYRDFEKRVKAETGMILPSYPASRELCAMGGIVSNNSGGELTLRYGKTEQYVRGLEVVLSDGSHATFGPLTKEQLTEKMHDASFEGEIYRRMHDLIDRNYDTIQKAKPHVTKNSAGYALWSVYDAEHEIFDLSKLIVGSQGTLALVTSAKLGLVKRKESKAMLIVFLSDLANLPDIVHRILKHEPESFESYDDHTFKLAVKFLPQFLKQLGVIAAMRLGLSFLPEVGMVLSGGVPKLVLMAEFAEDTLDEARSKAEKAREDLKEFGRPMKIALGEAATSKYWKIRRESFALLRKNLHGFIAAPFIDDFVVDPDTYPSFLPELNALLGKYDLIYTIAGHIGNGNFHIIPLMNLAEQKSRDIILDLAPRVYALVAKYGGSTTGEHNDGIMRTPYLSSMFKPDMLALFSETKKIFDPLNIFNPGKKVGGTEADIKKFMIKTSV